MNNMGNSKLNDKWNKAYFSLKSPPKEWCCDKYSHGFCPIHCENTVNINPLKEESCWCGIAHRVEDLLPEESCKCIFEPIRVIDTHCSIHGHDENTTCISCQPKPSKELSLREQDAINERELSEMFEPSKSKESPVDHTSLCKRLFKSAGESNWEEEFDSEFTGGEGQEYQYYIHPKYANKLKSFIRDLLLKQREGDMEIIKEMKRFIPKWGDYSAADIFKCQKVDMDNGYNMAIDDILKGLKKGSGQYNE